MGPQRASASSGFWFEPLPVSSTINYILFSHNYIIHQRLLLSEIILKKLRPTPSAFLIITLLIGVFVVLSFVLQRTDNTTPTDAMATHIVVEKKSHQMTLYSGERVVHTYYVALGRGGMDPKRYQGDRRTPEGNYHIDYRNEKSGYHRSLHISYPNPTDVKNAANVGKNPGGDIMIHGIRNGMGWIGAFHRLYDWTAGCIAVTDDEIEEIWQLVKDGTPVEIKS